MSPQIAQATTILQVTKELFSSTLLMVSTQDFKMLGTSPQARIHIPSQHEHQDEDS